MEQNSATSVQMRRPASCIALGDPSTTLNRRNEIFHKCRSRTKYLLKNFLLEQGFFLNSRTPRGALSRSVVVLLFTLNCSHYQNCSVKSVADDVDIGRNVKQILFISHSYSYSSSGFKNNFTMITKSVRRPKYAIRYTYQPSIDKGYFNNKG